jgi:K+-sensing histidine kinase KdpD
MIGILSNTPPQIIMFRYGVAVAPALVATLLLAPFHGHINATTVALCLLLAVLFVATFLGSRPALLTSLLCMVAFNFFFLPPVRTLLVADPQNWVALTAFLITAITAGQLSARARRRAEEAEAGKVEIERLYRELRDAFERASHAEALRRSEKLKSALLDAVSHDIRTPLTSIKASVTTLLDELRTENAADSPVKIDPESRLEMLEVIDEESDRLNHFVEGLIDLARIEAGEMQLRRQWTSIEEIIAAALERAKLLIKHHVVILDFEKDLPVVRVDSRSISEVVYTLVDNAAKYSAPGTGIRITARVGSGQEIEIGVRDKGPGIAPALRERVFEKFFRATLSEEDGPLAPSGNGMGLSIARGIVEAHGGRIWIDEVPNESGARFVFTIPIGDVDEEMESAELAKYPGNGTG